MLSFDEVDTSPTRPLRVTPWLACAIAVVAGAGLAVELAKDALPSTIVEHLSLSYEGNVPTWLSTCLLIACAFVAGGIARAATTRRVHWWGIAIGFGYASLDEASELHEHLGGLFSTGGVLYFDWVIVGAIVVLALAVVYARFLLALPRATRLRLVAAATIYFAGALGMELPLGWWTERHGTDGLGYALIDWGEEVLEMTGAAVALVALVRHREATTAQV